MAKVMTHRSVKLSAKEQSYLSMGLNQPGGKLPLFDGHGQEVSNSTILACVEKGYAERWFANPLKPEWLVCRLTSLGRSVVQV